MTTGNESIESSDRAAEAATEGLGVMLRRARESHGYSIEEMAASTRIAVNFIECLESEDIDRLPGEVFGRGFIRNICKILKIDETPYLAAYKDLREGPNAASADVDAADQDGLPVDTGVETPSKPVPEAIAKARSWFNPWSTIGIAVLMVMSFVGFRALLSESPVSKPHLNMTKVASAPVTVIPVTEAPKAKSPAVQVTAPRPKRQSPSQEKVLGQKGAESTPEKVSERMPQGKTNKVEATIPVQSSLATNTSVLTIRVTDPVRIRSRFDQQSSVYKEYQPQTYRFEFADQADLLIMDAGSVSVQFNGHDLGSLGRKGRVRRLSFSHDSDKQQNL